MDFEHRFIPGEDGERTLLLLHGTGGDEDDLVPLGRDLTPDANLLSPRGKVLENGMPRFFRRLREGVFDEEDLVLRTRELADFVEEAAREYGLDPSRTTAVGYSNGANIAASMLLLHPGTVGSAVLMRSMKPLEPENAPQLSGTPVLMLAGSYDEIMPAESTQRLEEVLRQAGAEVELRWQQTGHALTRDDLVQAKSWLAGVR
jgi:predicted esterase